MPVNLLLLLPSLNKKSSLPVCRTNPLICQKCILWIAIPKIQAAILVWSNLSWTWSSKEEVFLCKVSMRLILTHSHKKSVMRRTCSTFPTILEYRIMMSKILKKSSKSSFKNQSSHQCVESI